MKIKKQNELPLAGEGVAETTVECAKRILNLMQPVTSLPVVGEFLKSKRLHFSAGSWEDMRDNRIIPALRSRKITLAELNQQLAEVEEFGRCHTFLYTTHKNEATRLVARSHIEKVCDKLGLTNALCDVIIEELPVKPTITQIREETSDGHCAWVFKIIERREEKTFVGESLNGDRFTKEWKVAPVRAVNVAMLHDTGLLEFRVQSHFSSSRYESDIKELWKMLAEFLPPTKFGELSLTKAKYQLWSRRESHEKKIRFCDSTMRNNVGSTMIASTGTDTADLFEDSSIGPSIDRFLEHGAFFDSSNIWFLPLDGAINREVHVLLLGRNNEFAVTGSCTRNEYEYVLNELRANNR